MGSLCYDDCVVLRFGSSVEFVLPISSLVAGFVADFVQGGESPPYVYMVMHPEQRSEVIGWTQHWIPAVPCM